MLRTHTLGCVSLVLFALPAFSADRAITVDRGLPQVNLNNVSGTARSNVRWANEESGFMGDDFTVGVVGETWVIDSIRTWTVPEIALTSHAHLGDMYEDVRLYFGATTDLSPIVTASLKPGSDDTSKSDVQLKDVTEEHPEPYDNVGTFLRIWQVDFSGLNLTVQGGVKYNFGVWGMGRAVPGKDGKSFMWFSHASNAALSVTPQEGADGKMLLYDSGGKFQGTFDSEGNGWNKSSDLNVQIFAHRAK